MARKTNAGLLALIGLGVGAYFLFRGNGAAAAGPGIPATTMFELGSVQGLQSASPETLEGLISTGLVPPDAQEVFLDPTGGVPMLRIVSDAPGTYVVSSGALEGVAGDAGGIGPMMAGYGNQQQYYAKQHSPDGVFIPYGAQASGMAKLTGGTLQTTPSMPSPGTLGDYVQLPYQSGPWY